MRERRRGAAIVKLRGILSQVGRTNSDDGGALAWGTISTGL
jgi:hypothetical protein